MEHQRKLDRYLRVRDQLAQLVQSVRDPVACRATAVALIHHKTPGVSWTGFYMLRDGQLVVDVYQGPLACLVLEAHKGVCWTAFDRNDSVVVENVNTFDDHIACDSRTQSEIVVPVRSATGVPVGVLDLDSHHLGHFDDEDRQGLETIARFLVPLLDPFGRIEP